MFLGSVCLVVKLVMAIATPMNAAVARQILVSLMSIAASAVKSAHGHSVAKSRRAVFFNEVSTV